MSGKRSNVPKDGDRLLGTHVEKKTRRHHLDKRAADIASTPGNDDELLTTVELAQWLGLSAQWVEIGRIKNYGPPFERLSPRCIRYRRSKVREWLDSRTHTSTAEYRQTG